MKSGGLLLLVSSFGALALLGCGDDSDSEYPRAGGDAGADGVRDAAVADAAAPPPDPLYADPDELGAGPNEDQGATCVESVSDDRGAPLGCELSECRAERACCVGQAECCSATPESFILQFDTCTTDCVDGVLFGSPLPTTTNGFSPGGDADFDSGVVLDQRVDLRGETIRLTAEFVPPTASCSGPNCFQTVGVSVSNNAPSHANAHVRTIAGLMWSGGRIYLIVGERSIEQWDAVDGGSWTLTIDADGDVRVQGMSGTDPVNETFATAILPTEAYIVLHGHNVNPGGGETSAQLGSLEVELSQCEMTRQWSERTSIEVGSGLRDTLTGARSPTSVRDDEGRLRIAYLRDGRLITTLRGSDDTPSVWVDADEAYDALTRTEGTTLRAPELADEDGNIVLFYETGGAIFRAERTDDPTWLSFHEGQPLAGATVDGATIHAPTYASRGMGREAALVARVEWNDGRRSTLAAFSISRIDGEPVAQRHDLLPTDALGEELGDPELFIRNRLYQLYVPYRRGTRWRLAHMTSEDFVFWNIADDAALESGGPEELFGPRAPETVVSEDGVEVFYERFDGARQTLGRIYRRTPASATLQSGI